MSTQEPPATQPIHLRKYPNRRYYDPARSRHVTLEEIYTLVRDGCEVHVTDSKSGEDITAKVLAQIILEQDPPKLAILPVELLHQLIRANEPLVRDFVEKYFNQAFSMFQASQRQFEQYLRDTMGLGSQLPAGGEWARLMMGPLAPVLYGRPEDNGTGPEQVKESTEAKPQAGRGEEGDLRQMLDQLRGQVKALQSQLDRPEAPWRPEVIPLATGDFSLPGGSAFCATGGRSRACPP